MRFLISALSMIALGLGLAGCPGGGGGGGGDSTPTFAVATTAANFGVVGNVGYSSTLSATGGTPPYTWTDVAPALLLLGLTLDTAAGIISGTPMATTTHAFTATFLVTDFGGSTASGPVTLRIRPRTDRASVNNAGSSVVGSSTEPSISRTSGRFIAFSSTANLMTGVTGNQVYVHDRQTGQLGLVSKDGSGSPATSGSSNTSPTISADGRFIAFVSNATNLVGNFGQQIYLHDTQTSVAFPNGQTTLVSKDGSGSPATAGSNNLLPVVTTNGAFVAFVSSAPNLVVTVPPAAAALDIYVRALP